MKTPITAKYDGKLIAVTTAGYINRFSSISLAAHAVGMNVSEFEKKLAEDKVVLVWKEMTNG